MRDEAKPKRPTLERAVAAAPALLLAALLLVGASVPAWRDAAGRRGEEALGPAVLLIVMMLFVTRVSAIEGARGVLRALQVAAMAWYVLAFCVLFAILGWLTGRWWLLASAILLVAGRAHLLLSRREPQQRRVLFARSVVDFLATWVAAFASFPLELVGGPGSGMALYAGLFFAIVGLLDLFGVLVPEPTPTAHGWWERLLHPMAA